ncbi:MAG: squalene synthase HpnC [Gammaproteobacteria bacterium]|nr:squalene synthase HpnC [Gammaproteobacteria bacterium]
MDTQNVEQAYQYCLNMTKTHYENFPVASRLLPGHIRKPVSVIYAYARTADDYADEGDMNDGDRINLLDQMGDNIHSIYSGEAPKETLYIAIADVIKNHKLPREPFLDLLTAFKMDITIKRYKNFSEIKNYCRYSANPVGRLLLHLYQQATIENLAYSDAVCSALQLINFLQDIMQDYHENNRIYLPLDEMEQYGITEEDIKNSRNSHEMRNLIDSQIHRAETMLRSGMPLGKILKGRIGLELRTITLGGLRILQKLEKNREDVYTRPRLNKLDWIWIISHVILNNQQPVTKATA